MTYRLSARIKSSTGQLHRSCRGLIIALDVGLFGVYHGRENDRDDRYSGPNNLRYRRIPEPSSPTLAMTLTPFKVLRILILLILLAFVAFYSQAQRLTSRAWLEPLKVVIFPINGDKHPKTTQYIGSLNSKDFAAIDQFMQRESEEFEVIARQPTVSQLGPEVDAFPPSPPNSNGNILAIMAWSLRLRLWSYRYTPDDESNKSRIRLFVIYHQPVSGQALAHSLGLKKGLIGVVHAYADENQTQQNNVIIAHELLHTVGATDKYTENNLPIAPEGLAFPQQQPLYPQTYAEIMAGRIAISATKARIPESLGTCIIGEKTAAEINWVSDR